MHLVYHASAGGQAGGAKCFGGLLAGVLTGQSKGKPRVQEGTSPTLPSRSEGPPWRCHCLRLAWLWAGLGVVVAVLLKPWQRECHGWMEPAPSRGHSAAHSVHLGPPHGLPSVLCSSGLQAQAQPVRMGTGFPSPRTPVHRHRAGGCLGSVCGLGLA